VHRAGGSGEADSQILCLQCCEGAALVTTPLKAQPPAAEESAGARRREILEFAAQLFVKKGYRGTSMRDIGDQAGIHGGSLYHHIKSKDALFVELHNAALEAASERIGQAVSRCHGPWAKLEAAIAAMLEIQLDPDSLTLPMMDDFQEVPAEVRVQLIQARDRFEERFRAFIEALPLPPSIDRSIYRNLLLSQLNAAAHWYRPGRLTPQQIAAQILEIFKHE
jgi:AcrR family transcriptional regulator